MIDKELSRLATLEDSQLLESVHPLGARLLTYIGMKWRAKKVPLMGTVISDPTLIREVFMNRTVFSKNGKGASSSFWNPIIGDYGLLNMDGAEHLELKRAVSTLFSKQRVEEISATVIAEVLAQAEVELREQNSLDMVALAGEMAFLTMWRTTGFSEQRLTEIDVQNEVEQLRSVTEGLNPVKKKFSDKKVRIAKAKLAIFDELVHESYNADNGSLPVILKKAGYGEEVAASLTKSLFIAGTETVISFLPRMTALFVKSGYLDYLSAYPSHAGKGVEEALRVTIPTPVAARSVVKDMDFHGMKLKSGDRLILSTIGASKRMGDFDPFREANKDMKGLWFGAGVHMCIGVGLALAQAENVTHFLARTHKIKPLHIVEQILNTHGHTGSYGKLVIACKPL